MAGASGRQLLDGGQSQTFVESWVGKLCLRAATTPLLRTRIEKSLYLSALQEGGFELVGEESLDAGVHPVGVDGVAKRVLVWFVGVREKRGSDRGKQAHSEWSSLYSCV